MELKNDVMAETAFSSVPMAMTADPGDRCAPFISVIIPVYNGARYLNRAVDSVLKQPTSATYQIIIIDDGSKDDSLDVATELKRLNPDIVVIHQDNAGLPETRNRGMDAAIGKYLAFLDVDDWWEPDFFSESLTRQIAETDADIVSFSYAYITSDYRYESCVDVFPGADILKADPERESYAHGALWHRLYKRSFVEKNSIRFDQTRMSEDLEFNEKAFFLATEKIGLNKKLYNYYLHDQSMVHTTDTLSTLKYIEVTFQLLKEWYMGYGIEYDARPSLLSALGGRIQNLCRQCSYREVKEFLETGAYAAVKDAASIGLHPIHKAHFLAWNAHPYRTYLRFRLVGTGRYIARALLRIKPLKRVYYYLRAKRPGSSWSRITIPEKYRV